MALSDDGCNVDNANLMRDAMIRAKRQELPVLCHCEDTSMVEGRAVNEGSVSRQLWLEGRPAIAEELEVMRAAMLAEETGARVHICHISTAKAGGHRAPDEGARGARYLRDLPPVFYPHRGTRS